jgi:hypothetical protein
LSDGATGLSTIPDFCLALRRVSMLVVLAIDGLPPTPVAIGRTMAEEAPVLPPATKKCDV